MNSALSDRAYGASLAMEREKLAEEAILEASSMPEAAIREYMADETLAEPMAAADPMAAAEECLDFADGHESKLNERIKHLSDTFSEYLLYLIREKKMENAEVYKRAIVYNFLSFCKVAS